MRQGSSAVRPTKGIYLFFVKQHSGDRNLYWRMFFEHTETITCTCVCKSRYLQYTRFQLTLLFVLTHVFMVFADDVSISGYMASTCEATKE